MVQTSAEVLALKGASKITQDSVTPVSRVGCGHLSRLLHCQRQDKPEPPDFLGEINIAPVFFRHIWDLCGPLSHHSESSQELSKMRLQFQGCLQMEQLSTCSVKVQGLGSQRASSASRSVPKTHCEHEWINSPRILMSGDKPGCSAGAEVLLALRRKRDATASFFFISLSPGLLFGKWTWLSVLRLNGKCLEVHCLTTYWPGGQVSKEWVCGKMPSRRQDVSPGMYTRWALGMGPCPRLTVSTSALRHLSFLGGTDAASGLGSPTDTDDWS